MINLLNDSFKSTDGIIESTSEHIRLHGEGKIFGQKFHIPQKVYTFETDNVFEMEEYFVLEYKCVGIRRQLSVRKPFIFAKNGSELEPLVCYDDISTDNKRHSVIVKAKKGNYSGIKINFSIDRRFKADFVIYKMYSCSANKLPFCCENLMTKDSLNFKPIDISQYYNNSVDTLTHEVLIDGGRFFEKKSVNLAQIPFNIKTDGKNMIAPPPQPAENDEDILNFGVPAKRRKCRPVSRDGLTEVSINQNATEIFFIMNMCGIRHQRWGFATDGTILGTAGGDVTSPLFIDDVEWFMVEIIYKDGRHDTALPYNIEIDRHGIQGDTRVYAVAADGSNVEKIVFHNRKLDTDMSIIAVTVNDTDERLFPNLVIEDAPEKIIHNVSKGQKIELADGILTLKNGAITAEIDTSSGVRLLSLKNEFTPEFKILPDYMLKLRDAENDITVNFEKVNAVISRDEAILTYKHDSILIKVFFKNGEENDIKCHVEIVNDSASIYKTGVIFPAITGVKYADNNEGWYFFPKLQNINSNETAFIYEESAPSFPMQFMDVYSPKQQGGISLTTQERETVVRKYALEKDEE